MKGVVFALAVILVLGCASGTHAAPTDNGGNLVYDTEQTVTWYDSAPACMNWSSATSWVAALTAGSATAGAWSLPTAPDAHWGFTTEAEPGNPTYDEPADSGYGPVRHTGHFIPDWFWTGTEYAPHQDRAWDFGFGGNWGENDRDRYHSPRHHRHEEGATTPMPTAALLF